jgi:H+/Cl- antiporter ClcA
LAGVWFNNRIIKTYLKEIPKDESLKSYLERLTKGMRRAFRAVEITAIFIYPIAMTAGFLIPMTLENKLDQFSKGPFLWVLLFSLFVIITPLCFWLTRVLNKLAFGKYIDEIQKVLQQIEENQAF